jgi:neurofibromin 1
MLFFSLFIKHAHTKLEIVFFIYLWSIDPEAVKIAMLCFALFAYEADIRFDFDETAVLAFLPNYNIYMEYFSEELHDN